jgi:transcription elongation factor Elf1
MYRLYGTGQMAATAAVNRAIKRGELLPPAEFICVDCGKQAQIYEHRDYNKPLDVEPTCRPCNAKRGYAIPKKMTFSEFIATCKRCGAFRNTCEEAFEPIRRKYWPNEK